MSEDSTKQSFNQYPNLIKFQNPKIRKSRQNLATLKIRSQSANPFHKQLWTSKQYRLAKLKMTTRMLKQFKTFVEGYYKKICIEGRSINQIEQNQ